MLNKNKKYLEEGEPPPKKLHTAGDDLIKKLSEKQLSTSTSLQKELTYAKDFHGSEELNPFSTFDGKIYTLPEFENNLLDLDNLNVLKSKGLSDDDIKLFKAYQEGDKRLKSKFKNANIDVLNERIRAVLKMLENGKQISSNEGLITSRHQQEYLNSVKPNSIETILLEFALKKQTNEKKLPHPMDELPNIEKQLTDEIEILSFKTHKKIQKKARNLNNKIKMLEKEQNILEEPKTKLKNGAFVRNSLWDCREMPEQIKPKIEKEYTCKKPNYYTIRNGEIVKFDARSSEEKLPNKKLTIEEIRQIPKFENYEPGRKHHKLFLKNLSKNVCKENLRLMLNDINDDAIKSIKVMSGKMKGQAFIDFASEDIAEKSLELLNGTFFNKKPIIAQFANKKDKT